MLGVECASHGCDFPVAWFQPFHVSIYDGSALQSSTRTNTCRYPHTVCKNERERHKRPKSQYEHNIANLHISEPSPRQRRWPFGQCQDLPAQDCHPSCPRCPRLIQCCPALADRLFQGLHTHNACVISRPTYSKRAS